VLARNFADPSLFAAHCRVFDLRDGLECGSGKMGEFARGFIRVHRSYTTRIDGLHSPRTSPLYSMFAGGGSSMYDRKKLISIGGFDDIYAPFYWEDVELSYRAWKRGYSIVYEPAAVARHQISSTIGRLDQHSVRRIQQRNRLVYHWVHLQDRTLIASHVVWVLVLALTAPFRLKPGFLLSLWDALRLLPKILKRRKEEQLAALRTDKQVFSVFRTLAQEANIRAYDRREQLQNQINGRDRDAVSQD
jgi:GT2 family glycosyltransferase